MTKKEDLRVVKITTTVDEGNPMLYTLIVWFTVLIYFILFVWIIFTALEALVNNRISGLPVIDDDWNLVIV